MFESVLFDNSSLQKIMSIVNRQGAQRTIQTLVQRLHDTKELVVSI